MVSSAEEISFLPRRRKQHKAGRGEVQCTCPRGIFLQLAAKLSSESLAKEPDSCRQINPAPSPARGEEERSTGVTGDPRENTASFTLSPGLKEVALSCQTPLQRPHKLELRRTVLRQSHALPWGPLTLLFLLSAGKWCCLGPGSSKPLLTYPEAQPSSHRCAQHPPSAALPSSRAGEQPWAPTLPHSSPQAGSQQHHAMSACLGTLRQLRVKLLS